MLSWKWRIFTSAGSIAFIGWLSWLSWSHLGPQKPKVSPLRQQVAEQLIPVIVEDIRLQRGSIKSAALLHLSNDPSDFITNSLRVAIETTGVLDLRDKLFMTKARDVLSLRHPSFGDLNIAISEGNRIGVENVVFGSIERYESFPTGANLDVVITIASIDGKVIFSKRYQKDLSVGRLSQLAAQEQILFIHPTRRFLAWLVFVLLLPVFTISFIRSMVRKESNRINAFILSIYTIIDVLIAWLFLSAALSGWLAVTLFVVFLIASVAYNYHVMVFALKLES